MGVGRVGKGAPSNEAQSFRKEGDGKKGKRRREGGLREWKRMNSLSNVPSILRTTPTLIRNGYGK